MSEKVPQIPRVLPRGRHALSRDVVRASQRERILEATIELVVAKGYHTVTLADIVRRAGTARRTFYEHFDDKEDCFLASFGRVGENLLASVMERFDPSLDQPARAAIVIDSFLEFLAANPLFARIYFVDINTISAAGVERALEVRREIAAMLVALRQQVRDGQPDAPGLTEHHALAVVGAVQEIVHHAVYERGPERLTELSDELVPLVVAMLEMHDSPVRVAVPSQGRSRTKLK